ncbi:DUF1552 domain-containing protein [Marinicellulosiphila megalodicopiae]|uniref:DUF1552 domain-containing protein n=1 Tax=Marinicellulosiphila megalodicopiae TaxID=2724896 RepID=UPI003BB00EDF
MKKLLKTPQDVQRRKLFKTVAASGISMQALRTLPFGLGLMYSRAGLAADTGISRAIFVYIPDGAPPGSYTFNNGVLGSTASPLESVKENVVLFSDCTSTTFGHGNTTGAMGGDSGQTIDIELENALGGASPFSIIRTGVECNTGQGLMSYSQSFVENPQSVFERLFGGTAPEGPALQAAKNVLDRNRAEIAAIKSKLGSFERKRLEEHEAAINALEIRLTPEPIAGCDDFASTWAPYTDPLTNNFTKMTDLHSDLITEAFRCNMTNFACLQMGTHQAEHLAADSGHNGSYHDSIHGDIAEGKPKYHLFRKYHTERLAYLIKSLKDTTDPARSDGGSLLDSTIVLQVTDMGNGDAHDGVNMPFTLASGKHMNGGRYVAGATKDNLLNTVAEALKVNGEITNYGGAGSLATILK